MRSNKKAEHNENEHTSLNGFGYKGVLLEVRFRACADPHSDKSPMNNGNAGLQQTGS